MRPSCTVLHVCCTTAVFARVALAKRPSNTTLTCDFTESGRPGSNRHDQLGRLRFYH